MSPHEQLAAIGARYPWIIQSDTPDVFRMFHWCRCGPSDQHRHEFVVFFDRAGRVACWSEWRNYRASVDAEPGTRARLIAALTTTTE